MTNRLLKKVVILLTMTLCSIKAAHLCHNSVDIKKEKDLLYKTKGLNYKHSFVLDKGDDCQYNFDSTKYTNNMLYFPKIDASNTNND